MASSTTGPASATALPDYAPVPQSAYGPALNAQGYYVGSVERNLYWVTHGSYQCAFLTTKDGVALFDAPPTIGGNIQRAVDEIAKANDVSHNVTHFVYSHHHSGHNHADTLGTHDDVTSTTRLVTDTDASIRKPLVSVAPTPFFGKYHDTPWAAASALFDAWTDAAAAPIIADDTPGIPAAAVYTRNTVCC